MNPNVPHYHLAAYSKFLKEQEKEFSKPSLELWRQGLLESLKQIFSIP